ncbi:MAG: filamentous hemagglutinin N-terminal domain-containing protein, partial [Gammaproteobacteria bacterium]
MMRSCWTRALLIVPLVICVRTGYTQIVRDGTIGPDVSVQPSGPHFQIPESHGAIAGSNLFHSFEDFNIRAGESATFSSSGQTALSNVISRVSGGNQSIIDGLLRSTIPNADVFLLNPRGIVFGEGARLEVDGAFRASTASSLEFTGGESFDVNAPRPILNFSSPTSFGFLGEAGGPIEINGSTLINPKGLEFAARRIRVERNATLGSTTGNASAGGLSLSASESVSVADSALITVTLLADDAGDIRLEAPVVSIEQGGVLFTEALGAGAGGDITIVASERALFFGTEDGSGLGSLLGSRTFSDGEGGSIAIVAPLVSLNDGTLFQVDTFASGRGGDISITATQSIDLSGADAADDPISSTLLARSFVGGTTAGSITLDAPVIELNDGARLRTQSGGGIELQALDRITLSGLNASSVGGVELSTTTSSGNDRGSITLDAAVIELDGHAQLETSASADGKGGDIRLTAGDAIAFSGQRKLGNENALYTRTESHGMGGAIWLDAANLLVEGGATLTTETSGTGQGGNISVRATDSVVFQGTNQRGGGSTLNADTRFAGDTGSIAVEAPVVQLSDGAVFFTTASGNDATGSTGGITITAGESLILSGVNGTGGTSPSLLQTTASSGGGDAGPITASAPVIRLEDGARLLASTLGAGAGGAVSITAAEHFSMTGKHARSGLSSTVSASTFAKGSAGDITIEAPAIHLEDGATVTAKASSTGAGGDISIAASDTAQLFAGASLIGGGDISIRAGSMLTVRDSEISTSVEFDRPAAQTAGSISVQAPIVELNDGTRLSTGSGGNIEVAASNRISLIGVSPASGAGTNVSTATSSKVNGGSIAFDAAVIEIDGHARLRSRASGVGKGGDIELTASDAITFSGARKEGDEHALYAETSSRAVGGSISLNTAKLLVEGGAFLTTHTSGAGMGGNISLHATDSITFEGNNQRGAGSTLQASTSFDGNTGSLTVDAPVVQLSDGAVFFTTPSKAENNGLDTATGSTGSITITAGESLTLSGVNNTDATFPSALQTVASSLGGDAGPITVSAPVVRLEDGARILASTLGPGAGGDVSITAMESFTLAGVHRRSGLASAVATDAFAQGPAGNIKIEAPVVRLEDGALVSAKTSGLGAGGDIRIFAADTVQLFAGASLLSESRGTGSGDAGTVEISAGNAIVLVDSTIKTEAQFASGGNISLRADSMLNLLDSAISTSVASGAGQGGNISIDPEFVVLNRSAITARADAGSGGNITLVADHLIASADSIIDASANTGIDGEVRIDSPATDTLTGEEALKTTFLDVGSLLGPKCGALAGTQPGTLLVARSALDVGFGEHVQDGEHGQDGSLADETVVSGEAAKTLANDARAALHAGKGARGIALIERSEQHLQALASDHDRAAVLIHLANSHVHASTLPGYGDEQLLEAHDKLQAAAALSDASDNQRILSYALGNLGALYERQSRTEEALYLTRRALGVADVAGAFDVAYRWHWQEGRLLRARGQFQQATAAYRRAVSLLEGSRQDNLARYGSSSRQFRDLVAPVYLDLVDALLEDTVRVAGRAQTQALLVEARSVAEQLKTAEVRNYFNDQCLAEFESKQRSLDTIAPNAAVVYPIIFPERLELLV